VVVTSGPLMDKEAKVIEVKNKVAKVVIESLGYILIASISKKNLFPINKSN
jgi:ribosomal protein L24